MPSDNKTVVRRLYEEVWNKRKFQLIKELISPSHALYGPNFSGSAIGPEAYKHQVLLFIVGFPDLRFSVEEMIAEKDKIVSRWTISGTRKGEYMGIPATNKQISVDGITIHQLSNAKIMDSYVSWDMWGMMRQLGAIPSFGQLHSVSAR